MSSTLNLIGGRYRIISTLGEGGMGTAYRAWDTEAGIPVVIKMPKAELRTNDDFIERFAREIKAMEALKHPHIVAIENHAEDFGAPFVVMRFLPGGSLAHRLPRDANGKLQPSPPSALHIWLPAIASALDFVHANGVAHRDVKPDNIFFDAFSKAFLGDFGIAKVFSDSESIEKEHTLTATGMAIGTQAYMAPEMFAPKAKVDGKADQYALGIMAYELLCGARPFKGDAAHIAVEHCTLPPPPLRQRRPGLPAHVYDSVHRAMDKSPEARFENCGEFAAALLKAIPRPPQEEGITRLLCPSCPKILRLKESTRGKIGACPYCKCNLRIADDLGSLWVVGEELGETPSRIANAAAPSHLSTASTKAIPGLARWAKVTVVGLLLALVVTATVWLAVQRRGVSVAVSEQPPADTTETGPVIEDRTTDGISSKPAETEAPTVPNQPKPGVVEPVGTPACVRSLVFLPASKAGDTPAGAAGDGYSVKDLLLTDPTDPTPIFIPAPATACYGNPFEMKNRAAFAALKRNGAVVVWGNPECGGDSSLIANQLTSGVTRIFSTSRAFAALKTDGSLVAWGHPDYGGKVPDTTVRNQFTPVRLLSTQRAFAAIGSDGSVVAWGTPEWSDRGTQQRFGGSTTRSYSNRSQSGSSRNWDDHQQENQSWSWDRDFTFKSSIGDTCDVFGERLFASRYFFPFNPRDHVKPLRDAPSGLTNLEHHPLEATQVFATAHAVATLTREGAVETWGNADYGGESGRFAGLLASDVARVAATRSAFAVLRSDGSVLAFGNPLEGGSTDSIAHRLHADVVQLASTLRAFAAVTADGSLLTWGDPRCGGDSSGVPSTVTADGQLTQGITTLYANSEAFAAVTADGAVVAWGESRSGGNAAEVSSELASGVALVAATATAFAALKDDGSVVSWGDSAAGGDQSTVNDELRSNVIFLASTESAFAALKTDGSVIAWGNRATGGDASAVADALRDNVVSLATPFVDTRPATDSARGLLIVGNHAASDAGRWQYSLVGRDWKDIPPGINRDTAIALTMDSRLRYRPIKDKSPHPPYLSAVFFSDDPISSTMRTAITARLATDDHYLNGGRVAILPIEPNYGSANSSPVK